MKESVMIEVKDLHKSYHSGVVESVLKGVNFKIAAGESVALLGPSGSGKSTLLNCLGLLDDLDAGQIFFEGREVYVIGAEGGDDKTPQFWIDTERLYMSRIVYKKKDSVTDCVFSDYTKVEGNWVAKKVTFKHNGEVELIEKYYDLKFPKEINPDIFNPLKFAEIPW